jgi:hypothetical protein
MKPSPSKTAKAAGGKKRGREEATGSAAGTSPPVSPSRPDPNREWKKSKAKTEYLLALVTTQESRCVNFAKNLKLFVCFGVLSIFEPKLLASHPILH